ncbi:hypothetical protein Tco_0409731 [Tanacetum coccineum]
MGIVASISWPLVSAVPGLVTYLVASLTLDIARSCVMHIAFLTQMKVSSIPIILSWVGSISPDGFLPSILLLVVIIVAVAIVVVTVILVVVVGEGWANEFRQDKDSSVKVLVANFTLQSSVQLLWENTDSVRSNQQMRPIASSVPLKLKVFAMVAAYASRAVETLSATSFLMAA